jgi:hypothetical protein
MIDQLFPSSWSSAVSDSANSISQCSADRPECNVCALRGTKCVYDTLTEAESHVQALKRKYTDLLEHTTSYEKIYAALQSRPVGEANEIYDYIRRGTDAESVLRRVREGELLLQLATRPETGIGMVSSARVGEADGWMADVFIGSESEPHF